MLLMMGACVSNCIMHTWVTVQGIMDTARGALKSLEHIRCTTVVVKCFNSVTGVVFF